MAWRVKRRLAVTHDGIKLNAFDIHPFVLALTDATADSEVYPACGLRLADINGDEAVDVFDIDPFVELLTEG